MIDIKQKNIDRFNFLNKIYEISNGQTAYMVDGWEQVGKPLGFDWNYSKIICHFLNDEGLTEPMGAGIRLSLTHDGLKEIEKALNEPDKPTEHFAPVNNHYNTINIGKMEGGAIQQATNTSTINYTTSNEVLKGITELTKELKEFIAKEDLSNDEVEELETDIETIEVQSKSKKPKTEIFKTSLNSIKSIMERIIAGVATKVITSNPEAIITKVNHLLQLLQNSTPN